MMDKTNITIISIIIIFLIFAGYFFILNILDNKSIEKTRKYQLLNILIQKENKTKIEICVENILLDELIINPSIKKIKK